MGANDEMTLGANEQIRLAIFGHAGQAGMGLDIGLMHGLGIEGPLNHDIRLLEPFLDITKRKLDPLRDVRGFGRRRLDPVGDHVLMEERRIGLDRVHHIDHVGQDLVVDLDQGAAPRGRYCSTSQPRQQPHGPHRAPFPAP